MCYTSQYIGGQYYQQSTPVMCQGSHDIIDIDAGYQLFRNGKLIASIAEQRKISSGTSISLKDNFFGFLDLSLKVVLPTSSDYSGEAGPFYDYDPHNTDVGTPLSYEIRAVTSPCGPGYTNSYSGGSATTNVIWVDSNGDGRPDYYPESVYISKKAEENRKTIGPVNCKANPRACR
jgi:hypothetical protein